LANVDRPITVFFAMDGKVGNACEEGKAEKKHRDKVSSVYDGVR
jgi:hypothetical protein